MFLCYFFSVYGCMLCLVRYLFVISTSVIDCLGRFVPEMTYYVSIGTLHLTKLKLICPSQFYFLLQEIFFAELLVVCFNTSLYFLSHDSFFAGKSTKYRYRGVLNNCISSVSSLFYDVAHLYSHGATWVSMDSCLRHVPRGWVSDCGCY